MTFFAFGAHVRRSFWLSVLVACSLSLPSWALPPDPLAQARAVYAEVNQDAQRMSTQRFFARVPGADYTSEVVASTDKGRVRKLAVTDPDDSGSVLTDLYFDGEGALVFALRTTQGYMANGRTQTRNEHRLYFQDNRLLHMLAGMAKAPLPPGDPLAQTEAGIIQAMAVAFRKAAVAPPSPTVSVGSQRKLTQGRVIGLDSGDTACHIELADAEGRVHHELADFALCEKPQKLLDRQVTLAYSTATVMAAACQGNTRCTQKDTVALVTRATLASTAPNVVRQTPAPRGSWCTDAETDLFTCHPGGNRVSVCASKGATARQGQLQYRFGPAKGGAAELNLPATATPPARSATGEAAGFSGGGGAWLRFSQGNHAYVVYSGVGRWGKNGATEERHGVQVERNGKVLATLVCRNTDVNELGPDWFAGIGVAPDAQGFSFPDTDD